MAPWGQSCIECASKNQYLFDRWIQREIVVGWGFVGQEHQTPDDDEWIFMWSWEFLETVSESEEPIPESWDAK